MQFIGIYSFILLNLFFKNMAYFPLEDIDRLKDEYENMADTSRVEALIDISHSYKRINADSSLAYAWKAVENAKKMQDKEFLIISYFHLCEAYNLLGEIDSVNKYADISMEIAENANNEILFAKSLVNQAQLEYLHRKMLISARKAFQALEIFRNENYLEGIAYTNYLISRYYIFTDQYDLSMEHVKTAEKYFSLIKDTLHLAEMNIMKGILYHKKKMNDSSMASFFLSKSLFESQKDKEGIANVYRHIGDNYARIKDFDLAASYYRESRDLFLEVGSLRPASDIITKISHCQEKTGNYQQAIELNKQALEIRKEVGDTPFITSSFINTAIAYYHSKEYRNSIIYLDSALSIASKKNDLYSLKRIYYYKHLINEQSGNAGLALSFYKEYNRIKEELAEFSKQRAISNVKLNYELNKAKEKLTEAKSIQKNTIIYSMLISLVLVIMLAIVIYARYRSKIAANKKLREQDQQLRNAFKDLEHNRSELAILNEELEDRVEERTQQLEEEINKSKEFEAELKANHYLMSKITELLPMALFIFDLEENRIVWTNFNVVNYFGYTPGEIKEFDMHKLASIVNNEDLSKINLSKILNDIADKGYSEEIIRITNADGTQKWMLIRGILFKGEDEMNVRQILGVAMDDSDRKRKSDILSISNKGLKQLFDFSKDILWTANKDLRLTYLNLSFIEKLGIDPEKVIGRSLKKIIEEEKFEELKLNLINILPGEQTKYVNTYIISGAKRIARCKISATAVPNENDTIAGYVGIIEISGQN